MEEEKEVLEEGTEGESSTPEEPTVPIKRFNEVYGQLKTVKEEIESLKSEKAKSGLTPDQEKELQAKVYLKGLLKETLEESEKSKAEAEQKEIQEFKSQVDETLSLNPDVKRADFVKFLEKEADDYGIKDVAPAMKLYRQLNKLSSEAKEKAKEELKSKPGLPSNEGGAGKKSFDDSGKNLTQIAEEVIRGLK